MSTEEPQSPGMMARAMKRFSYKKFLCCLPPSFGVFTMSSLGLCIAGIVAAFEWIQVSSLFRHPSVAKFEMFTLVATAAILTLLSITSAVGLFAVCMRHMGMLKVYTYTLYVSLFINVGTGSLYLSALFRNDSMQRDLNDCVATGMTMERCRNLFVMGRMVLIFVYVITWLIILYGALISSSYLAYLKHKMEMHGDLMEKPKKMMGAVFAPMDDGDALSPSQSQFSAGSDAPPKYMPRPGNNNSVVRDEKFVAPNFATMPTPESAESRRDVDYANEAGIEEANYGFRAPPSPPFVLQPAPPPRNPSPASIRSIEGPKSAVGSIHVNGFSARRASGLPGSVRAARHRSTASVSSTQVSSIVEDPLDGLRLAQPQGPPPLPPVERNPSVTSLPAAATVVPQATRLSSRPSSIASGPALPPGLYSQRTSVHESTNKDLNRRTSVYVPAPVASQSSSLHQTRAQQLQSQVIADPFANPYPAPSPSNRASIIRPRSGIVVAVQDDENSKNPFIGFSGAYAV